MLITLVIIGVVAVITVPSVLNSLQNQEFKVGYKKAFSDLSQAAAEGVAFGEFPYRDKVFDDQVSLEEWQILKNKFGVLKVCEKNNAFDCWVDADRVCVGCGSNYDGTGVPVLGSKVFIDLSGRAWVQYTRAENIFLVDINGDKAPNRFGKDRWMFTFADEYGNRICTKGTTEDNGYTCSNAGYPKKVTPLVSSDIKQKHYWCQHPTCYYKSWLID